MTYEQPDLSKEKEHRPGNHHRAGFIFLINRFKPYLHYSYQIVGLSIHMQIKVCQNQDLANYITIPFVIFVRTPYPY